MAKRKPARNTSLPDRIVDEVLGGVTFSAALDAVDEYQAIVTLNKQRVTMDLYTDETGSLQPCILRARSIVQKFAAIQQKFEAYISSTVYPKYAERCSPNQKPLPLPRFPAALKLRSITTHPEPRATFWFDAGETLFGHSLMLTMAERNRFVDYDTPG